MTARPLADLLRLFVGPGLWFGHFSVVYATEALVCRGAAPSWQLVLWIGAAASLTALAALGVYAATLVRWRSDTATTDDSGATFLRGVALLLALLSMLGVAWTALPLMLVKACMAP